MAGSSSAGVPCGRQASVVHHGGRRVIHDAAGRHVPDRSLEEHFNIRLFDRTNRRISLTWPASSRSNARNGFFGMFARLDARMQQMSGQEGGALLISGARRGAKYPARFHRRCLAPAIARHGPLLRRRAAGRLRSVAAPNRAPKRCNGMAVRSCVRRP